MTVSKEKIFALAKEGKLWAGNLIDGFSSTDCKIENRTPIDNSIIGYIADGNAQDVEVAVKVARETFEIGTWSKLSPPSERKK